MQTAVSPVIFTLFVQQQTKYHICISGDFHAGDFVAGDFVAGDFVARGILSRGILSSEDFVV